MLFRSYGSVARLWLENPVHNPDIYILVDFPESLFFAEVFLRMNIKDLRVLYAADSSVINQSALKPRTVILCPITNVAAISGLPLDLVINTGSMQEMPEDWVDFWMDWFKRQDCRFFYSLNYFAQPLQDMAEAANTWSPRLPQEWIIRLQRFDPVFVKLQSTRRFAEILAEKSGGPFTVPEDLIARYELTKSRYLDGQTLLECMDIVRLCPTEGIVWDLLMRCYSEMRPLPKESYWLADHLNSNASPEFKAKHGTQLQKVWSDLQSIRARGREDTF